MRSSERASRYRRLTARVTRIAAIVLLSVFHFGNAVEAAAQAVGSVRGLVRDESSGLPLSNATIQLVRPDWVSGTTSDESGAYLLDDVPVGRSVFRVRHIGHEPFELEVVVAANREVVLDVSLPLQPVALAPVNVDGLSPTADTDSVPASSEELGIVGAHALETTPGLAELGFADAIRGIPGQEPPDPGNVLYVRGAAADLKLVYLDGAPVYAPFPLGGLIEPFAPELLHSAEIYLGGAPARYDGGLSYVMDLKTRGGVVGGARTSGSIDLLSARLLAEGGVSDRFRVIATARGMHPLAASGLFNEALPYQYQEGVVRGDVKLGRTTTLSVTGFDNWEAVRVGAASPSDTLIEWGNRAGSIRLRGSIGETSAELTTAIGDYAARLPFASSRPLVAAGKTRRTRWSADFSRTFKGLRIRYGGSFDRQSHNAVATTPSDGQATAVVDAEGSVLGGYGEVMAQVGNRVSLRGGLRADRFSSEGHLRLGPRIAATWFVNDGAALTIAAGTYHQLVRPPDEVLLTTPEGEDIQHIPSLTVGRASHFTAGLDQNFGEDTHLGIEGFYKHFSEVPGTTTVAGNASGVDVWVRRTEGDLTGWLGYSLAWAWSSAEADTDTQPDFSGRHLLSAGFGAAIGARTHLDLRFAYGAGLPYSAIPLTSTAQFSPERATLVNTLSTAADRAGTEAAPLLHAPDNPYLRLDASISQRWTPRLGNRVFDISPYVRVLNGLGQRDALFYYFDSDSGEGLREIGTLPFIPVLGVEWKF
ncbi:MAG: TonB-dependent receptor plug domain-containing protein [Gemmatimonas sp.]|nr:TonB-dependent receptor plug domain-containing protein [Gemmatimonas sp.]